MTNPPRRIFISYSRKDGGECAAKLRSELEACGHTIWQDLIALESGPHWWSQIEEVLRSKELEHFVLVLTPGALESGVVKREIGLARQEGKTVSVVRGPGIPDDFHAVPRWVGHVYFLVFPEQKTVFLNKLQQPGETKRVPMMAPEPPADFVPRPREFGALKAKLLDGKGDAVAITAALKGAGGYGKTTLARALAHDDDVQSAYYDGMLWVELGERPENLLSILSDLVEILSGERPGVETVNGAATKLAEALGERRILLVIDDVWREQDLRPFLQGGRNTTRLITTRLNRVLPPQAESHFVDAMQVNEARTLLASGLPEHQTREQTQPLTELAKRLGEWAQLLKLVNGFLRDRVLNGHQPPAEAVAGVNKRLDAKGLVAFDARNETERTKAVARTIGISLDLLDGSGRTRFAELGVFPEDTDVPLGIVARLWQETGGLDELDSEDLLNELADLSLLLALDLDQKTLRLHDTVRHFLQEQAGKVGLIALHKQLLMALDGMGTSPDNDAQHYYYQHLPHHLAAVAEREQLDALLIDPGWLKAKLAALHSPQALVADYDLYATSEFQRLIGRTLRLTMGICARDERQLIPQLIARLLPFKDYEECSDFLDRARLQISCPALVPLHAGLTPPGAEVARLEGAGRVNALCPLSDGRLASASEDGTIRLWDVVTGVVSSQLKGHESAVRSLCLLPDGRLASGSDDSTIRLWDVSAGAETARLEGHQDAIGSLCLLPDGHLASGSRDNTIKLWDLRTGTERVRLQRVGGSVTDLAALPDGHLVSGSRYYDADGETYTIRLWDPKTGTELAWLEGQGSMAMLPDGRIVSGWYGHTIRLQDLRTGGELARFEGQHGRVSALAVLSNGCLASGSSDRTIRLWNPTTGKKLGKLEGHGGWVTALAVLPHGRLASGSDDNTIRLWEPWSGAGLAQRDDLGDSVTALAVLSDGCLVSGSHDNTIRLWNPTNGAELARLEGQGGRVTALAVLSDSCLAFALHSYSLPNTIMLWDLKTRAELSQIGGLNNRVTGLAMLPDGRLAVSSDHETSIRIWDLNSRQEISRLRGHCSSVKALAVLPDGRLGSGSADMTIRLWDTRAGAELAKYYGHGHWVVTLAVLPDGRLASGSHDKTIWIWDLHSGEKLIRLKGHGGRVHALAVLPDGRLASGSDDRTIRLWDLKTGGEVTRLEVDAEVEHLIALPDGRLVAGDMLGRLHWLEIVD